MKTGIMIATVMIASLLTTALPGLGTEVDLALDLDTLWPSVDGNHWEYEQTFHLADWMMEGGDTVTSNVGLRFDGTTTAFGGAEVQNLVEELPLPGDPAPGALQFDTRGSFFKTLWIVRPDLRPALAATYPVDFHETAGPLEDWVALFLHGGAFELTTEEIVTWRTSLQIGKSWMFLVSNLTQGGDSFQLQLIPDLAPDVFLTGTLTGIEDVNVPGGLFERCLRIDYVLDFGTSLCTSPDGPDILGSFRAETTGSVHYAPGIGPVRSEEELRYHNVTGECGVVSDEVAQRIVLELTTTNVTVPTRSTTWGNMKTRYLPEATAGTP